LKRPNARLILEDNSVFTGYSFGHVSETEGEVVFNTGMVGYPETLTDPSYNGQLLVCTYPLIGNYGVPQKKTENKLLSNFESDKIHVRGLLVSDYSDKYSHWDAVKSLDAWLKEENVSGVYGIDTRRLTRKLRSNGTMLGKIVLGQDENTTNIGASISDSNVENLVGQVSITNKTLYMTGKKKIVIVDCGVKNNIIHAFLRRNISVIRVNYNYDFSNDDVDGFVISNGPGDPKKCENTIHNIKKVMSIGKPILGICLGSQLLGLAAGADTYKLKYGHRSHNQPVKETGSKRCYITSQNHGYAIDTKTLTIDWREWFINENDGTNEGIIHISKPFFGTQFHPEASPGPDDTEFIFDMFVRSLK